MKHLFLTTTAFLLIILFPFVTVAGGPNLEHKEHGTKLQAVDAMLAQGESQQALDLLEAIPEGGPDSAEISWRIARAQYEMGRLDEQNAPKLFKNAEEHARIAITEDPDSSDSYKWLAIALGAQAKYSNTKSQVSQSREIKENIEKAIELNPEDDISFLVLSRWHYKVSDLGGVARIFAKLIYGGLPEASLEKSEELMLQAIELHDRVAHRYNLAKIYKRMGRDEEAITQLELALLLPVTFPEELKDKEKARKKLKVWD